MNNNDRQAFEGLTEIRIIDSYPEPPVIVVDPSLVVLEENRRHRSFSFRLFAMVLSFMATLVTVGLVVYNFISASPHSVRKSDGVIDVQELDALTISLVAGILGVGFIFTLASTITMASGKRIFPAGFVLFILGNALIIAAAVIFHCTVNDRKLFSFDSIVDSGDDNVAPEDLVDQYVCIRAHPSSSNYDINGYCGKAIATGETPDTFLVKAYWWYWFSETRREVERAELYVAEKYHLLMGFSALHAVAVNEYRYKLDLYYNSTRDGSSFLTQEYRRRMMEEAHTRTKVTERQLNAAAGNLAAEEDLNGARKLYYESLDKNVTAAGKVKEAAEKVALEDVSTSRVKKFRGNNMIGKEVVLKGLTGDLEKHNGSTFYVNKYMVAKKDAPLMLTVTKAWSIFDIFSKSVVLTVNENNVVFVELDKAQRGLVKAEEVASAALKAVVSAKKEFKRAINRTAKAVLVYKDKLRKSF